MYGGLGQWSYPWMEAGLNYADTAGYNEYNWMEGGPNIGGGPAREGEQMYGMGQFEPTFDAGYDWGAPAEEYFNGGGGFEPTFDLGGDYWGAPPDPFGTPSGGFAEEYIPEWNPLAGLEPILQGTPAAEDAYNWEPVEPTWDPTWYDPTFYDPGLNPLADVGPLNQFLETLQPVKPGTYSPPGGVIAPGSPGSSWLDKVGDFFKGITSGGSNIPGFPGGSGLPVTQKPATAAGTNLTTIVLIAGAAFLIAKGIGGKK